MGNTSTTKKGLNRRIKSVKNQKRIKRLNFQPVVKNVDIDELKASFGKTATKKVTPKKEAAPVEDTKVEKKQVEEVVEKKVEVAKEEATTSEEKA